MFFLVICFLKEINVRTRNVHYNISNNWKKIGENKYVIKKKTLKINLLN